MSSYKYFLIDSDDTEGIHDSRTGITHVLPEDLDQLFVLQPHVWKEEIRAHKLEPHDLLDSRSHFFKSKVFKHPNTCQVCNEVIWNEGRLCRACKLACHRKCQYKVTTECKSSVNNAQYSNSFSQPQAPQNKLKLKRVSIDSNQNKMTAHVHAEISPMSRGGESHIKYSFDLDVDYITERLIGVSFPSGGLEAQYRSNLRDVVRMLKSKHQDNYVIFNLSQKRHDLIKLNSQVYDLGWPDHLAPPLEKLCSICKHIETWLKAESQHVVVLHCKGGRGPIGMIVSAYMNYINITSNSETAMDRYAMKRFLEAKTESAMHPSQHRYVNYFTGLLMRSIQVNSAPLFLHHVLIHGVPNYDINGGCRPFLRVYQGMQPIYTSPVFSVPEGTGRFAITLDQALPIRGDILIKCYHKKFRATTRDVIFRCQFHTTAIMECRLVYQKSDLDDACTDARFPEFTKVEFVFSQTPDRLHGSDYVPGSNFPVDNSDDPLIRWDSYENFETTIDGGDYSPEIIDLSINMNNNIPHSSAPDGSLYAEVQKTPSPICQENPFFSSPYHAVPPTSPTSNQLKPIMPGAVDYEMGPRSPMQTTQMAVLRAKMNAQKDPGYQTSRQRTPSPRTPTSDPPSPLQPQAPSSTQPISQSPAQRPTELMNGPKSTPETPSTPQQRMMNYKERRDLDDLLRGIGDNAPVTPSSESQRSRDEVVEKRKIVDIQAQMSQLPPMESQRSPTPKIYYPQPRSALDLENPYAEITDAVPNTGMALNLEASQPNEPPIMEQIAFTRVETVESVKMQDLDKIRTPQNHDNPTYAATKERDQLSQSSAPQRTPDVSHLNNINQYAYPLGSNQPSSVWEPQPLRAKKEQLVFIYKEDPISPRGPPVPPLPEEYLRNQSDQPDSSKLLSSSRTSTEVSDDAMTWLQKQQQKLKEKREREGAVDNPTFQTPRRELPSVPEPRRELSPEPDRVPEPMYQSQIMTAPRDEIPTDNLTWLEQKQRKLQEKRQKEDQSGPLFINTSHQSPSYGMPSTTDSSGLNSAANGSLTRPQLTDLEKSISQLSNIKSPDAPTTQGPMTPPHTYEHESNSVQLEMWQSHQRPLNRQASDTTFDREKPISLSRQKNQNQAPQTPAYVASLPPSGSSTAGSSHDHITNLSSSSSRERHQESLGIRASLSSGSHPPSNTTTTTQPQPNFVNAATTVPTDLSRDSGYASSLSSTLTGNEPPKSTNVTRVVEADGSEVTTTTTTECKKKIIHVFPGKEGFDLKKLPSLLMEEIKKDESGGLQNRLMELMKEKGVGESPKQKRKVESDQRQFGNHSRERSTVHSMSHKQQDDTPETKLRGDLLKTVKNSERHSSGVSCILSAHNSSQNVPHSQSTNTRDFSSQFISGPSSPLISSSRRHNSHHQSSMTSSQNPLDKSFPKTKILKSSHSHANRKLSSLDQPFNKDNQLHNLPHQMHPLDSFDQKTSKLCSRKVWSHSLPKSVTYKKHGNGEVTSPSKMDPTEASRSSHEQGFTPYHKKSSNQEVSSKRSTFDARYYHSLPKGRSSDLSQGHTDLKDSPFQDGSQFNSKKTPSGFEHSTQNSMFYSLPRSPHHNHNTTPGAGLTSTSKFSHLLGSASLPKHSHFLDGDFIKHNQTISGQRGKPMAYPAPFMDDTLLFQPVPSYQWVMQRIGGLRSKSQVKLLDQREVRENQSSQSNSTKQKSDRTHYYRDTQGGSRSKSTDRLSDRTNHNRDIQGESRSKSTERVPDRTQFYRETQGGSHSKSTDRLSDRTHHSRDIQGGAHFKTTEQVPDQTRFYRETQWASRSKSVERVPDETQLYREPHRGSYSKSTERVPDQTQYYKETHEGLLHEQGITEKVRGRPLGRSKHRSEKRSQSQNHDVWQRKEKQDNSHTERQAVSADRSRLYTMDYLDNSTRTEGGTAGHAIGSNNYGTIRSRHTNHSNNANPASLVTSGMSQGDQTNQNVNNINLMAGLEDAIRMLSEWTHLQNQELTNPGPSSNPPCTKHNMHVSEVVHRGDVTAPSRQPNLPNGWISHSANHQSHTQQHRHPGSTGPAKEEMFEKVDLHIDESQIKEPLNPQARRMDEITDVNNTKHPKSQPSTGPLAKPGKAKQMPRRTPHQSGYDSDSAVQQYIEPQMSHHPGRAPSPETWLHNPGGLPVHESEYWNRMEGLKSPNPKEQWARKPEQQDYGSSSESLQNGGVTPRFPVGPKAYKNMVSTPIAIVGRPPHSPDAPYPLSPIKRDDRDVLDTSGLQLSPSRQLTTQTASPMSVDSPMPTSAQNTTPGTPEIITVTRKRTVQNEVTYTHSEPVEVPPPRPQLPILATVERLPAPPVQTEKRVPQNGQHYPVEVKVDRVPVTNYSIQEPVSDSKAPGKHHHPIGGFPPSPKKEVTFQDARGGVPEKPTGPQALAGSRDSPITVQEQEIVPTRKVPAEVAPTWPIELEVHIRNEGMGPAISDVEVKGSAPVSETSPQPISSSVQYYKQTTYIQEPASPAIQPKPHDDKAQPVMILEPELQQGTVIQKEPNELCFSSTNLSAQPPPPQYPTYSDRMKNKPPPPMYPTFSDRHRKAATGRTEEVSPQVANGYHTMYDNRGSGRVKRASTGSDGVWPVRSPNQRKASDGGAGTSISGRTTPSNFYLMQHPSPYSSSLSLADTSLDKVRFVKDLSAWWYKPHISRDEAIMMLKDKLPGTFVVRDSNSFPGAFGLAVKVAQLPPNAPPSKKATDPASELVRHFLIEPNPRGVRLKGCANEPIFGSLSALIYQHTLTQLALPCKLQLPDTDPSGTDAPDSTLDPKSAHNLLSQGAACNVLFLGTVEMESLTGPSAVGEATTRIMNSKEKPKRVIVHFKVSLKGVTITDNQRKLFFRRHYPVESVLYCGMDSGSRKWKRKDGSDENEAKIFGFVARKPGSKTDNQCHVFAEYEIEQPASAIVSFVTKVLLGSFQNQVKTP